MNFVLHLVLLSDSIETFLNIELSQLSEFLPQISQAHLSGFNSFPDNPVGVLFLGHVLYLT